MRELRNNKKERTLTHTTHILLIAYNYKKQMSCGAYFIFAILISLGIIRYKSHITNTIPSPKLSTIITFSYLFIEMLSHCYGYETLRKIYELRDIYVVIVQSRISRYFLSKFKLARIYRTQDSCIWLKVAVLLFYL